MRIGYIAQVFPSLTMTFVYREIYALRARGIDVQTCSTWKPDIDELSEEAKDLVADTFYIFPLRPIRFLLSHIRALLTRPKLLILDEPTEGIQPNIIDQIGDAIRMLRAEGSMSILLVEQFLDFCRELGDDFAILERGSVAAAGTMAELSEETVKEFLTV